MAATFDPAWLTGHDLLYFDLHGEPGAAYWYGDAGIEALTADQIGRANLAGTIVFAVNCYLADDNSPMLDALLDAGARYVIGGPGKNYAGVNTIFGAGLLARSFRRWLGLNIDPLKALSLAKARLRVAVRKSDLLGQRELTAEAKDGLEFRAFYRRQDEQQRTA